MQVAPLTPKQIAARAKKAAKSNGKPVEKPSSRHVPDPPRHKCLDCSGTGWLNQGVDECPSCRGHGWIADDDEPITLDPDEGRESEFDAPANGETRAEKPAAKKQPAKTPPRQPGELRQIPLPDLVASPTNPRKEFARDELDDLADSIRSQGILEPLLVRPNSVYSFEIIAGERRFRAAKIAGLENVPCVVVEMDDHQVQLVQLVENLQREDLSPIEEARAFLRLTTAPESPSDVHGVLPPRPPLTQQQLAGQLGLSQGQIANRIRLLDLPEAWQDRVAKGELSASHARELVPYAQAPTVLAALEKVLPPGTTAPALKRFTQDVQNAVMRGTAPLSKHTYTETKCVTARIDSDDPRREELQIVEVQTYRGKEKRCLNKKLATKILNEKLAAAKARHAPAGGKDAKVATAAKRAAQEAAAKQYRELRGLWKQWLGRLCAPDVKDLTPEGLLRVLVSDLAGELIDHKLSNGCWTLPAGELCDTIRANLRDFLAGDDRQYYGDPDELAHLCQLLDVDPRDAFVDRDKKSGRQAMLGDELTEEFLELLTDEQCEELLREWKLPAPPVIHESVRAGFAGHKMVKKDVDPKVHLVEQVTAAAADKSRPPLPLPALLDQFHWSQSLKKKAAKKPAKKARAKKARAK